MLVSVFVIDVTRGVGADSESRSGDQSEEVEINEQEAIHLNISSSPTC